VAALLGKIALLLRAQIGPYGVVELQVAAAGLVERRDRVLVGLGEVGKERAEIRIDVLADAFAAGAEVQRRRRRNGRLRRDFRVAFHEAKVIDEGVVLPVDFSDDPDAAVLGLDAGELDAVLGLKALDAAEPLEEVEMPPGATI